MPNTCEQTDHAKRNGVLWQLDWLGQEGDRAQQSKIDVTEAAIRQNGSLLRYERSSKRSHVEAHSKGKWGKNRGLHDGAIMEPAYKVNQVMLRNTSLQ